jgi:aspartyl-tRNA(Asn)/glutamyl-tRNA(Gln) amidotransferase subunit B
VDRPQHAVRTVVVVEGGDPVTDRLVDFDELLTRYEPVIGLETHVELGTASKMFCGCATTFGAEPNTQTCPVCLGLPGALPVANAAAIEATVRIGLALGCRIASWCRFARKNYFYPDIPKGFQTSQYDEPLCIAGHLDVEVDGETYRVEIERVHLEEDTGKNLHVGGATGRIHGADHSLVDYNRAGIPLVEIVTRPVAGAGAKAPEVARAYVTELREILLALGVSEVRMEQGNLRSDVNTSLNPIGGLEWGTRTETKNVNSLRSVERAVRYEMRRQAAILDAGERVLQETRHMHEDTGSTSAGRSKEEATDYRYFPEPDLVPVAPDAEWVEKLRVELPELPAARRARLGEEWGLSPTEMSWIVNAGALGLVADTVAAGATPADARKWWLGELARRANDAGVDLVELDVTPQQVAELSRLVAEGTVNDQLARQALDGVLAGEGDPAQVVEARGLAVMGESDELVAAVDAALAGNPDVVAKVQGGKVQALGALVGAVMKATRGKADAATVKRMLEERVLQS